MNRILRITAIAAVAIVAVGGFAAMSADAYARGGQGQGTCRQGAAAQPAGQARITVLDTDRNGAVSLDEFLAGPRRGPGVAVPAAVVTDHRTAQFRRLDANGDGVLTPGELGRFR
ncbi:hypothetical protein [Azospirillum halopraeferens]|uniref:hypothetical protein n=1 Tax=Azospirillum halopraeferens TaxID=34010 RepID=UPI000411A3CA|nr:hypothetical protein [Azospirillum halopraeferens]